MMKNKTALSLFFFLMNFFPPAAIAEVQFIIEYVSKDSAITSQRVDFKESDKEKKFVRYSDRAQCTMYISDVTPLVASYRKVQMDFECKDQYSKSTTSFTCQDSELKADPAKIRAKRKKEEMELDLSVPKGVEVHRPKKRAKRGTIKLEPAWDETGCQKLGEAFAQLGPRAQVRCCRVP